MQIKNNVFIVTGGASGLGEAVSRMIAANGGHLLIADVQADKGEALARELGNNSRFIRCDVTSEQDAKAAVEAATALGALRGLVNCAGIAIGEKTVGKDGPHALPSFARVIGINLIGTFNMIRIAAEAMSKLDATADAERGVLINTASVAAYDGQIGQAAY
ncbi:MAG TPA: SDR family NAD(P)-dependent oxidoreductase, partial [Burkholderiaceae bacterium]|nr:SDR family NAD(P)-dependent oxidoreductase [Burkholderiaceae bacterium]